VLRFLDSASKLFAARCSLHLYRLAQAPFVWQGGAPGLVRSSQTDLVARLREHPLLRHAPIHLRVDREERPAEQVLSIPLLHTLSARGWDVEPCEAVLQSPRVQQLCELHLPLEASPSLLEFVATACPALTALSFDVGPMITDAKSIKALGAAPCLSNLRLFFLPFRSYSGVLDGLRACSHLTSLSLHGAVLDAAMLAALHSPELTARLQHLTLVGLRIERQSRVLLSQSRAGVFGPLARLQSLTLGLTLDCSHDALLQRLPSSLELLEIEVYCIVTHDGTYHFALESATLQAVLLTAPKLIVRMVVVDAVLQYYQSPRHGGADGGGHSSSSSSSSSSSAEPKQRPAFLQRVREYLNTLRLAVMAPARVEFVARRGSALDREAELQRSGG